MCVRVVLVSDLAAGVDIPGGTGRPLFGLATPAVLGVLAMTYGFPEATDCLPFLLFAVMRHSSS
jgi:hypothetical protein